MSTGKHPKIQAALDRMGESEFNRRAEALLARHPKCRVVLGLLGGASQAVNINGHANWRHTAGRAYARMAVRYERGKGIVDICPHSGPYLYVAL